MKSLIQALAKAGRKPPFSFQKGFQSYPNSLNEIIRILNLPKSNLKTLQHRMVHDFTEENAQGLTYAYGNIWFLSSGNRIFKYSIKGPDLYRPSKFTRLKSTSLSVLIGSTTLDKNHFDHIGDIDYFDGLIFASIRRKSKRPPHLLLVLSTNLEVVGYSLLTENTNDSWCAINPWNRCLYMPVIKRSDYLNVYDVSEYYNTLKHRDKWRKLVKITLLENKRFSFYKEDGSPDSPSSIQGIAFSENGRLYVTRYNGGGPWENFIYVYNTLTGSRLSVSPEYDFPSTWDEIEGLSIHPSGVIYVAVADNDWPSDDEFEIHAFKYPKSYRGEI